MFQRGSAGLTPNAKLHAAGFCPPAFLSLEYLMALHERKSSSLVPGTPAGREAAPSQPWVHTHVVKEPVALLCYLQANSLYVGNNETRGSKAEPVLKFLLFEAVLFSSQLVLP